MNTLTDIVQLSRKICHHPIGCELKYATEDNFVGRVIDGYDPNAKKIALLTEQIAQVICQVQNFLVENHQMSLFVFDAYRPKRAVRDFLQWVQQPPADQHELEQKAKHYPDLEKSELFHLDYLSADSKHCYGNTIDCVLQDIRTNQLLEMGAIFDFFGERSHSNQTADIIGETAFRHRQILLKAMQQFGFQVARTEYWHFHHKTIKETHVPLDVTISPMTAI